MWSRRMLSMFRWRYFVGSAISVAVAFLLQQWVEETVKPIMEFIAGNPILSTMFVGVLVFLWILILSMKPRSIDVAIRSPITIRDATDAQRYARRGFVGFIPLYRGKLNPNEVPAAVQSLDFDKLDLPNSNLWPTIQAILAHRSRLEHCWLLTTKATETGGSFPYARVIAEYLRQREGVQCEFHYGDDYTIPLNDDALVLKKTYDLVRQVFDEANRLGLSAREIVADITTGIRSMALGMVLASLDWDRDIEFVGARYGPDGLPDGRYLVPIIFTFEPHVVENP